MQMQVVRLQACYRSQRVNQAFVDNTRQARAIFGGSSSDIAGEGSSDSNDEDKHREKRQQDEAMWRHGRRDLAYHDRRSRTSIVVRRNPHHAYSQGAVEDLASGDSHIEKHAEDY